VTVDVTVSDPRVRIVGKGNVQAHVEDVNADGLNDLVVQIEDADGVYEEGEATAALSGKMMDGTSIKGYDSICVVPQAQEDHTLKAGSEMALPFC
jgi:hypothetical protein